jgi:hypothetical protein
MKKLKNEVFKQIPEFPNYFISNMGRLYTTKLKLVKKFIFNKGSGYYQVILTNDKIRKNFSVHRLLALAFIPNPQKKREINHKDGNKTNNNLSNLEWITHSENALHAYKNGLHEFQRGEKGGNHKLTEKEVLEIRRLKNEEGYSYKKIAKMFHIGESTAYCIVKKLRWGWL